MYLKRLELHGFKTFADRTELEFTPGITAIVGPNGSGKSNVFDAIRWALGEMSAKSLRGGRMDDVIFAGSEGRRGMGMGEISLTINNDSGVLPVDYSEVAVTRRVNRGGEGEYFLNMLPCRLRDIQMLFLGTGLGGRSYSLIGQGQVDSVLNAGPEERRVLLEEAAGLARYKRRRREAERRLGGAGLNLQRVADVLAELTAQLEALREQAQAAMQYQAYSTEIRDLELGLQVDDARRTLAALKRIVTQAESVQQQLQTLATSGAEIGGHIDRDRARAADVARQWEEAQRALLQIVEDLSGKESTMQVLAERVRGTGAQRDRLAGDEHRLQVQLADAETALAELRAQAESLEAQRDQLLEQLRLAEQAQGEAAAADRTIEEQLAACRAEITDLTAARTRAAHDLARLEERTAGLDAQVQSLTSKRSALAASAERLSEAAAQMEASIAELLTERDTVGARLDGLRTRRDDIGGRLAACDDELRRLSGDRQVVAQTLAFLEDMHGRLAGYEQGARDILLAKQEHPERFAGIRYPVLELLRVAAPHRAAIEAALGRRLFSLVAASVEDVKGGLRYLRGNGQGGASFIPVDLVPARRPVSLPGGAAIVGRATDLVELTNGAGDVVDALLGDVVVVASLDDAVALRAMGFGGRIATLDGELLTPDGVITVRGKPEGEAVLLGRREQIETLRARQIEVDAAIERITGQRIALQDQVAALDEETAAAQADATRLDEAIAEQQAALAPVQVESARLPVERGESDAALAQAEAERTRLGSDVSRLRADDAELRQALLERETVAAGIEAAVRRAAERTQATSANLTDVRVQLAELAGTLEALRTRVDEHAHEAADLAAHRDQLQGEITVLDGEHHLLTHSLEEAQRARTALVEQQDATRTVLTALEEE
ncbi:MAG TPA: chromosome segregation protein SMC, partial [bacterium]|nr:chromosome segregation protein SMC [bacterium]